MSEETIVQTVEEEFADFVAHPASYDHIPGCTISTYFYNVSTREQWNESRRQRHKSTMPLIDPVKELSCGPFFAQAIQEAYPDYFSDRSNLKASGIAAKYRVYTATGMKFELFRNDDPMDGFDEMIDTVFHRVPFVLFMPHPNNEHILNYSYVGFHGTSNPISAPKLLMGCLGRIDYLCIFLRKIHAQQLKQISEAAARDPYAAKSKEHYELVQDFLMSFYSAMQESVSTYIERI